MHKTVKGIILASFLFPATSLAAMPIFFPPSPTPNLDITYTMGSTLVTEGITISAATTGTYIFPPAFRPVYGDLYRGTLHNAELVVEHELITSPSLETEPALSSGNYFVAVYEDYDSGYYLHQCIVSPATCISTPTHTEAQTWFSSSLLPDSSYAPPDWGVINFRIAGEPLVTNLGQFKSDGATPLTSLDTTTEDIVVIKGTLESPTGRTVRLEAEIRPFDEPFTDTSSGIIATSTFGISGTATHVIFLGLTNGRYHFRARAVDDTGSASAWQEGAADANFFEVKLVPLYTQVVSQFPQRLPQDEWAQLAYGAGNYPDCKDSLLTTGSSTIRRCGCALTSFVMLSRYYGVTTDASSSDVNPRSMNDWFTTNSKGFNANGNVVWDEVSHYTSGRIAFNKMYDLPNNSLSAMKQTLDAELFAERPSIIYQSSLGHFLLVDGKLATTYTVRDPRWYNTRFLSQNATDTKTIRNYGNTFTGLRTFAFDVGGNLKPTGAVFMLASPAELLLVDSLGRREGYDPRTNTTYDEIPSGEYSQEGISAAPEDGSDPLLPHESKILRIPTLSSGVYTLQVIGTGSGTYTLDTHLYDAAGGTHATTLVGTTSPNFVTDYAVQYIPENGTQINVTPIDHTPPEARISLDMLNKQLAVVGVDDLSEPSVRKSDNIYFVTDSANNTLRLTFDRLKTEKNELKADLEKLHYNGVNSMTTPDATLSFEWSLDNRTNSIKELKQKIDIEKQVTASARYDQHKNQTEITVKRKQVGHDTKETRSGLVLLILTTNKGILDITY